MPNSTSPGTHVIHESSDTIAQPRPSTYSARDSGRQKYSGSALLARSGAIVPGPTNAVRMNARLDWMPMKIMKNSPSISNK